MCSCEQLASTLNARSYRKEWASLTPQTCYQLDVITLTLISQAYKATSIVNYNASNHFPINTTRNLRSLSIDKISHRNVMCHRANIKRDLFPVIVEVFKWPFLSCILYLQFASSLSNKTRGRRMVCAYGSTELC